MCCPLSASTGIAFLKNPFPFALWASSLNYELPHSYKVVSAPFIARLYLPTFSTTQRPLKAKNRVIEGWEADFTK